MILVDIMVPVIDKIYDFQLDENAYIGDLVEEIGEIIANIEQDSMIDSQSTMLLCDLDTQTVMDSSRTLKDYGISTGRCLIYV